MCDFDYITAHVLTEFEEQMKLTLQPMVWHGEGDVFTHTMMLVDALQQLPGTGKDTWIARNIQDLPMISLDEIRRERKISPKADQGNVANIARAQAKEYLRRHQPFVWNATNITTQLRESLVGLFETYHARVRIVYLETDWQTLLERNGTREGIVPQAAIEAMFGKMTVPEPYEARQVEWICL